MDLPVTIHRARLGPAEFKVIRPARPPERAVLVDRDRFLDFSLDRHAARLTAGLWSMAASSPRSLIHYVVAGLIIQKVTGRPLAEEMGERVIRRIGLRHTYFPAPGDTTVREPHAAGYQRDPAGAPVREVTEIDPSAGWAAGQMISTGSDLNRFYGALLAGRLLPAAQLAQMRTTVPIGDTGAGYGLGIVSRPLSCGGVYWGHGGDIPGYETRGGATEDGRAANVTVTGIPADPAVTARLEDVVDTALCRS